MKSTTFCFTLAFAGILSLAALGIGAAVDMPATLMSRADYQDARQEIEGQMRRAIGQCRPLQGTARTLCKAQVRADERVRVADLQARYHGTVAAAEDARTARARAAYDLAKARCADRGDEARLECLRGARSRMTEAMGLARLKAS
jgi:hypothetical protein